MADLTSTYRDLSMHIAERVGRIGLICVLVLALCWMRPQAASAQGERNQQITPEKVVTAIARGVSFLKQQQQQQGNWEEWLGYRGGMTALCTLAMLNAGVSPSDPSIQKSLAYLRTLPPEKTYVASLQTMVLAAAEPQRDLVQIQRNVKWLESVQISAGPRSGSWGYQENLGENIGDNSNTQFAILALHEAEQVGAKVNSLVWQRNSDYWIRTQNNDGSWGYQPGMPGTGSMTCAGIGALVISSGKAASAGAQVLEGRVQCCGGEQDEGALARALAWLGTNFSVRGNPYPSEGHTKTLWHYYYLYGVERVGRLTGQRKIGGHDWYREGAHHLVLEAKSEFAESWNGSGPEDNEQMATALALLFLSKGRRPVVIAKAQHPPQNDWNHHPSDLQNIVAYTEQAWELDLTWQIYNLRAASADDLLQTPVLFLSGSRQPDFVGQEGKLRDYIDRGGMIFAEACCSDSTGFRQGFEELVERIFPEPEYRLRRLEPQHPIWRAEKLVRPDSVYAGKLWAVEYGCRTCVVFSEIDLSCYWSLYQLGRENNYPQQVRNVMEDALIIGLNVLTYATGREPKHKEENFVDVAPDDLTGLGDRGVIQVAKLQHGGGANDAPGALANLLLAATQGEFRLRVSSQPGTVTISEESLREVHLAFMHGRHEFRLGDAQRQALRTFLERGGTLLADAICGSTAFASAFRREMQAVFADQALTRIPPDDPLFSEALGGYDIRTVIQRDPIAAGPNAPLATRERPVPPELEGIQIDGRWAVVFSPVDLSCALEKHESLQCRGYTREDAARIALNVLVYALNW